jgi:hypothetical protein
VAAQTRGVAGALCVRAGGRVHCAVDQQRARGGGVAPAGMAAARAARDGVACC